MITIINGTTREQSIAKLKEMVANERPISVRWADFIEKGDYAFDKATPSTTAVAICDMPEGAVPEFTLVAHLHGIWIPAPGGMVKIKPKIFITTEHPIGNRPGRNMETWTNNFQIIQI